MISILFSVYASALAFFGVESPTLKFLSYVVLISPRFFCNVEMKLVLLDTLLNNIESIIIIMF